MRFDVSIVCVECVGHTGYCEAVDYPDFSESLTGAISDNLAADRDWVTAPVSCPQQLR